MISPNQLTKENGFEDGVVVEAVWSEVQGDQSVHYFQDLKLEEWLDCVSIRPLTGPMAIWNFAPEWAEFCGINTEDGRIDWAKSFGPAYEGIVYQRPFWAKETK